MKMGEKTQTLPALSTSLDLVARRGLSVAWSQFGFEKMDVSQKTTLFKLGQKSVAIKESSTQQTYFTIYKLTTVQNYQDGTVSKALALLLEFTDALSGEQIVTVSYL